MNISLTPELEELVQQRVASGFYNSASEVIRDALRLLFMQDDIRKQKIQRLNEEIEIGLQAFEENRIVDGEEAFKRLKARNKRTK